MLRQAEVIFAADVMSDGKVIVFGRDVAAAGFSGTAPYADVLDISLDFDTKHF
jgi:hypothetical protein